MIKNKNVSKAFALYILFCVCHIFSSCGPSINSFVIQPLSISNEDSVRINWDVRGTPTLLVRERPVLDDSEHVVTGALTPRYVDYQLVVERGGKEVHQTIQVVVYPAFFTNEIIMEVIDRIGDTIIAKGIKDPLRWGRLFEVVSVSTGSMRELQISHSGKVAIVDNNGTTSLELKGTPIEGEWEIKTVLNEEEKRDEALIPSDLKIIAVIQYKKR
jgi:hypothetical protein